MKPVDLPANALPAAGWQAELELAYARRGDRSILVHRRHRGPLVVQKPLWPEGDAVCHTVVLHPPGGIVGGDQLRLQVEVGQAAHALLTTPGAGKWYRSLGPQAAQRLVFEVAQGGVLEWLPQETLVYDGACAEQSVNVELRGDAVFAAQEVVCLGRINRGERFTQGHLHGSWRIVRDGRLQWLEGMRLAGSDPRLGSAVGMAGKPVWATVIVAAPQIADAWMAAAREVAAPAGQAAVTRLPGVLLARWLGPAVEPARQWCTAVWQALRPHYCGRAAEIPRIWRT